MTRFNKPLLAAAVPLFAATLAAGASGQIARSEPPLVLKSTYGADLYQFYCSSCHGATGRGRGARSDARPAPPDLTALASANGGVFPRDRVRSTITFGPKGAGIRAHGTADMPVWGAIFRGLETSDSTTEIRIENLVKFIETLQDRPGKARSH